MANRSLLSERTSYFSALWRGIASSYTRFLDHTQRRATVGRTPLSEWSIRRRNLYLTTHNNHNRKTSTPPSGIRTHDHIRRAAVDLRLGPRGYRDRHMCIYIYIYVCVCVCTYIYIYIGFPRKNGQNFGRVFLTLNYTDITQNTYIQSWTVREIMAREFWNFDSCYTLTDYQIHIKTGRNMWFL